MGTGATVVFVPGFMQPAEAWAAVAAHLPERYPSVLLAHAAHDLEGRIGEIIEAGEANVVAGYSLGGRLTLHAALRPAAHFRALVTLGSAAGIEDPARRAERRAADEKLAGWIEINPIADVVALWERQPLFADQSEALVEAQRPGRLGQDPNALARLLRTAGQGACEPIWQRLRDIAAPVLALAGARDERYADAARRIAAAVPEGRAVTIEDAGHAAHLQAPGAVARVLVEFLDEHLGERVV